MEDNCIKSEYDNMLVITVLETRNATSINTKEKNNDISSKLTQCCFRPLTLLSFFHLAIAEMMNDDIWTYA